MLLQVLKQEAMETSCCHELDNLKMDVTNGNVSFESSSSMSPSTYPELSKSVTPKPMDTSSNSTTASSTDHHNYHTKADVVTVNSFFNETLDLSQEDIQKTLSANMPASCSTDHIAVGKVSFVRCCNIFCSVFILQTTRFERPDIILKFTVLYKIMFICYNDALNIDRNQLTLLRFIFQVKLRISCKSINT